MKKIKHIPTFKSEDDEREFWSKHDLTEFQHDLEPVKLSFPNLKLSREVISLRLPSWLLNKIKMNANRQDVPYQSYMKMILANHVSDVKNVYLVKKKKKATRRS